MTILRGGSRIGYANANRNTTTLAITTSVFTAVPYLTEHADTDDIWEPTTNPTRFLTPAWCTYARVGFQSYWEGNTTGRRFVYPYLNGAAMASGRAQGRRDMPDSTWETISCWGAPVAVATPGTDYYEIEVWQNSGANRNLAGAINWGSLIVSGSN